MKYLYIFEGGTIAQSDTAPVGEDLLAIRDGVFQVLYLDGGKYWDMDEHGIGQEVRAVN